VDKLGILTDVKRKMAARSMKEYDRRVFEAAKEIAAEIRNEG
jgi:hypothetical protein